jgi:hypothetical protein
MKDYKEKGLLYEITLDNDKVVKVSKKWVDTTMKSLETDLEETLLMWLEDNDYLVNEEQEELNQKAKENKVKIGAKEKVERKTTTRERKPNPTKENIIKNLAATLETFATDVNIENIGKIITFKVENKEFKLDLTEKRVKKQ